VNLTKNQHPDQNFGKAGEELPVAMQGLVYALRKGERKSAWRKGRLNVGWEDGNWISSLPRRAAELGTGWGSGEALPVIR